MSTRKFWLKALRFILVQPLLPVEPARCQTVANRRPYWETPAYLRKMRSGDRAGMRY